MTLLPETIGLIAFAVLLIILMAGIPIGASLALIGTLGLALLLSPEAALIKVGVIAFDTVSRYELGVLPLFMLMAQICFAAGASGDFFGLAAKLVGHKRGGLGVASIGGCAGFGAISGSSLATVATVSAVALPEMRRQGYHPGFAAGALAAGGTLGSLIPPSGALIVFGIIAEQSIGKLFAAAVIPGITQALFYVAVILIMVRWKPELAPPGPRATWRERGAAAIRIADISLLVLFVVGGLVLGWFTPTEAASIGCVGALGILLLRRKFTREALSRALFETLRTTGMIYAIVIGAIVFSTFVSVTEIPDHMTALVESAGASPTMAVIVMAIILLLLGSFLDGLALMLLMTPILLPVIHSLGLSPVWFGIFLVRTMEIGFVHPPLGFNVYVIHAGARDIPLGSIFRGVIPFLVSDFLHLAMLIAFPAVVLWLPSIQG
ncbi:TRAP transporter large permease [Sphingomonas sp. G-3-2-10]|uniref:TRAP transporter large permease n=1 Tax=Sphingomonas sp. G-3-2-10 TaxID=2728838 RepID=UPI003216EF11